MPPDFSGSSLSSYTAAEAAAEEAKALRPVRFQWGADHRGSSTLLASSVACCTSANTPTNLQTTCCFHTVVDCSLHAVVDCCLHTVVDCCFHTVVDCCLHAVVDSCSTLW